MVGAVERHTPSGQQGVRCLARNPMCLAKAAEPVISVMLFIIMHLGPTRSCAKGRDWELQSREPKEYSRNTIRIYLYLCLYMPTVLMPNYWGSLPRVPLESLFCGAVVQGSSCSEGHRLRVGSLLLLARSLHVPVHTWMYRWFLVSFDIAFRHSRMIATWRGRD